MLALSVVKPALARVLDAVLPPRCLKCGAAIDSSGALCAGCWRGLSFLGAPCCACCGLPFEFDLGENALCAACSAARPPFRRQRAVLRYDESSRDLILAFKHADRTDAAPALAAWMARAGEALLASCDLVAPVPLHWTRLFRRRYNQAGLLAAGLARRAGKTFAPDLLIRGRATVAQGRKSRFGRFRNVKGAFAVNPRWQTALAGKTVLLIDDVVTTGATVSACARVLAASGAGAIDVLAIAQVIRAD